MERYATPSGEPCPRCLRDDGVVVGTGACTSCGCCLLLAFAEWPGWDQRTAARSTDGLFDTPERRTEPKSYASPKANVSPWADWTQ